MLRLATLVLLLLTLPGCFAKWGGDLAEGFYTESSGQRETDGINGVARKLIEEEILRQLGEQLGSALVGSAMDELTEQRRTELEATIAGAMGVLTQRTAKGLRDDVSPELREMVRQDIVETLAEGIRGDLADSLDETVDKVITTTVASLTRELDDADTKLVVAGLIRESMYQAMREGRPGSPSVSETLETTLSESVLTPFERSVGDLTETVADRVDESAKRTERTLQGVISALVVILGVFILMYALTRRQLNRARTRTESQDAELRSVDAALNLLDPDSREQVLGKVSEYTAVVGGKAVGQMKPDRSDDYER